MNKFKAGDIRLIHNHNLTSGRPFIEGRARLVDRSNSSMQWREVWSVKFVGSDHIVTRIVLTDKELEVMFGKSEVQRYSIDTMLEEIGKAKVIHAIVFRKAGVAIEFTVDGKVANHDEPISLTLDKFYSTLQECVLAEYARLDEDG